MWKGAGVRRQAARPRTCCSFAAGPWASRSNLPSQLCSIVTVKPLRWVPTHRNTEPTLVGGVGLPALHADGRRSTRDRRGSPAYAPAEAGPSAEDWAAPHTSLSSVPSAPPLRRDV